MERRTSRRSESDFATSKWMIPAPMSNPSSTTYIAIMTATRQNQIVSMMVLLIRSSWRAARSRRGAHSFRSWAVLDFAALEEKKENAEHRVHAHEADQCKPGIPRRDLRRNSFGRAQEPVDQPRLAADLCRDPSGGVSDVGEREREHQSPQHEARREEPSSPKLPRRGNHDRDKD